MFVCDGTGTRSTPLSGEAISKTGRRLRSVAISDQQGCKSSCSKEVRITSALLIGTFHPLR